MGITPYRLAKAITTRMNLQETLEEQCNIKKADAKEATADNVVLMKRPQRLLKSAGVK